MKHLSHAEQSKILAALPEKLLIIRASDNQIEAASREYLAATITREEDIVGQNLFDVFPDDPDEDQADGVKNLRDSLARVKALKRPDIMPVQRYPIRHPDGHFEERSWSPVNTPVLNDQGEVAFILHKVEDVTDILNETIPAEESTPASAALHDIVQNSRKLRENLTKLQEYEARMRTAERLLQLGAWEFNVSTGELNWTQPVYEIYGVSPDEPAPSFEAYFNLVHADDREDSMERYRNFEAQKADQIEFEHRVIGKDAQIRHIKGVGERHHIQGEEVVVGFVQDISPIIETHHQLEQARHLLELGSEMARLGGWRVELNPEKIIWSKEVALIHGAEPSFSPPSVEAAVDFYAPEYRALVSNKFKACVERGERFDIFCRLNALDGTQPWVRAIGVAEYDQSGDVVAVQGAFQEITELQEAVQRAETAEARHQDILENTSDAFLSLDKEWRMIYVNKQAAKLLEQSPQGLLGNNLWELFPDVVGTHFYEEFKLAVDTESTTRFEAFYAPLRRWFDVSAYPTPEGLTVFFRDISREKDRLEQIRLIEGALANQDDIVIITKNRKYVRSQQDEIIYVNRAFEKITGYTSKEALGQSPTMLQGPDTSPETLSNIRQAINNETPIRAEILNYSKSGDEYWLELSITPLFDESGECTHFVAVERDITQRKAQQLALIEAQERFELIAQATNDVISDWDLRTGKVWWGASMEKVFGFKAEELESGIASWRNRLHPDDKEKVISHIESVIHGTDTIWRSEYRFLKRDGDYADVIDRGFIIRDETGSAVRMVGSMIDNTDRKEIESRLRESQKLEAIGHLTGGVSHDFNNLLTIILGNAELIQEQLDNDKLYAMLDNVIAAANRGATLTGHLLAYARRKPLQPQSVDINKAVASMRDLILRTLPEGIEIKIDLELDIGRSDIDLSDLDTALLNLVVNARDAMPDGGTLTLKTENVNLDQDYSDRHAEVEPGSYVMICVSDTGKGMDADTLSHVFEPFFTTKAEGKGTGLGLSMVFGFMKQSGGHVSIDSTPDVGTSIKLYFPKQEEIEPAYEKTIQGAEVLPGDEHILVAEDDDLVRQNLELQLKSLGYHVTSSNSGPSALEILHNVTDIDLLLTDVLMPGGMNGRELADKAKALHPRLKVIYSSGYTEDTIVHQGRVDKDVTLLSKPYSRSELASTLRSVLDH